MKVSRGLTLKSEDRSAFLSPERSSEAEASKETSRPMAPGSKDSSPMPWKADGSSACSGSAVSESLRRPAERRAISGESTASFAALFGLLLGVAAAASAGREGEAGGSAWPFFPVWLCSWEVAAAVAACGLFRGNG